MDIQQDDKSMDGPMDAVQSALKDGIERYKALKDAHESRTLLASFMLSFIGSRSVLVALVVLSYQLGEGALGVGGMLAIQMLPSLLLQPFAGALVDKFPGKRLLILCQVAMALLLLSYLLLLRFETIWLLYGITFVRGMVNTLDNPAFDVRLMSLTPIEKRRAANAVQSLSTTFAEVVGPLTGGVLLALFGMAPVFVLASMVYLWFGIMIARLPERVEGANTIAEQGSEKAVAYADADKQGYRGLLKRPMILMYLASVGSGYLIFYGITPLFIVRALELGMTEATIGVFFSALGLGGLLGGIFSGMGTYTTKRALAITGVTAVTAAMAVILFGIAGTAILAFPMLILVGMLFELEEIPALTYFQNSLPESVYGRFFSLFLMVAAVGGVTGQLLAPILAERFNTGIALTVLGIPAIVFGILFAVRGGGLQMARNPFAMSASPAIISAPILTTFDGSLDTGFDSQIVDVADDSVRPATTMN